MTFLSSVVKDRTDLEDKDLDHLQALLADWTLLADLSLSDLVLWIPTWHGKGFFAAAQTLMKKLLQLFLDTQMLMDEAED